MRSARHFAQARLEPSPLILDRMTIRRFPQQRTIAWMAVIAILLLSIVPTVSQLFASLAPRADRVHHAASHAAHVGHYGHELAGSDNEDRGGDDCWRKCGYCDLLAHTPAIGTIAYVAAFAPTPAPIPVDRRFERSRYSKHFQAAQPRGPPVLLA